MDSVSTYFFLFSWTFCVCCVVLCVLFSFFLVVVVVVVVMNVKIKEGKISVNERGSPLDANRLRYVASDTILKKKKKRVLTCTFARPFAGRQSSHALLPWEDTLMLRAQTAL